MKSKQDSFMIEMIRMRSIVTYSGYDIYADESIHHAGESNTRIYCNKNIGGDF
jgi:hypothetical protein